MIMVHEPKFPLNYTIPVCMCMVCLLFAYMEPTTLLVKRIIFPVRNQRISPLGKPKSKKTDSHKI